MASFAALVSLQTIIHTLRNHPNPPISLDNHQVESLLQNVTFLQDFLELYSHRELYPAQDVDNLIKSAAYAAEDIIESYIVDRIGGSTSKVESSNNDDRFYQDVQKVVEEMDRIKRKVMETKEKLGLGDEEHESGSWDFDASTAALQSSKQQGVVVGFDDVLVDLLDKLTRNKHSSRQIIPIVGMGGIGKTTLALKAFEHGLAAYHFDIRVWVTISQKFKIRDILLEILCQRGQGRKETLSQLSESQLGERIHKELFGRRYLVVLDDMWSSDAWDEINRWFPDNKNGSVVIVTTRLADLARQLTNSSGIIPLNLLDEGKSWKLFCKTVFREDGCPSELEKIGKTIVENCRGLPLSIVVIGGFVAKSNKTKQYWEDVARNISGTVNLEDNERCLKILYLSYRHLPVHLKSCFLYMGIFPEDARIEISWLVKLLAAEGFLKPIDGMMMEDVVEKYINELVERNLIIVDEWGSTGKVKSCKIHDLLRDLCIREAHKDDFFCDVRKHKHSVSKRILSSVKKFLCHAGDHDHREAQWCVGNLHYESSGLDAQRRIVVRGKVLEDEYPHEEEVNTLESASLVRSIILSDSMVGIPDLSLRLLRVLTADDKYFYASRKFASFMKHAFQFYNSRYLILRITKPVEELNLSSVALFWNLQTLIVRGYAGREVPIEIWKLPQLQHIDVDVFLNPPSTVDEDDNFVMWNLTSLSWVRNFKSSEVVKRIPNIQKLSLGYSLYDEYINLEQLHKLEHLKLYLSYSRAAIEEARRKGESLLHSLALFPHSLKKLHFDSNQHHNWEEVTRMMGALPNLQKLTLFEISGTEWRLTEVQGQFSNLKVLKLINCFDLECWTIDGTPFPLLQRLYIELLPKLGEIPCEIGEIPNIQSICVSHCSDSCVESAKRIAEEQEQLGNPNLLQVSIILDVWNNRGLLSLEPSANLKIEIF